MESYQLKDVINNANICNCFALVNIFKSASLTIIKIYYTVHMCSF